MLQAQSHLITCHRTCTGITPFSGVFARQSGAHIRDGGHAAVLQGAHGDCPLVHTRGAVLVSGHDVRLGRGEWHAPDRRQTAGTMATGEEAHRPPTLRTDDLTTCPLPEPSLTLCVCSWFMLSPSLHEAMTLVTPDHVTLFEFVWLSAAQCP